MSETRRVHLHRDSDAAEEGEKGLSVRCPFCGEWSDTHDLMVNGCSCGATAQTEMAFEKEN